MNRESGMRFNHGLINVAQRQFLERHCFPAHQLPPEFSLSVHDLDLVSSRTFGTLELPLNLRVSGGAP